MKLISASRVPQCRKVLTMQANDLSLIFGTYGEVRELTPQKLSYDPFPLLIILAVMHT